MTIKANKAVAYVAVFAALFSISLYFTYAAVQGDSGLFRRAEIEAREKALLNQLEELNSKIARMENLTHRLSDNYLDIDLLDEQARRRLGRIRSDEIVIR
ncbi:MAG: septum formation initiator family protein [Roseovarius sp.]|nr:septum formation initiator family protein [Roseovarius sp.]MCY4208105.1 septum formation initiator family protein [Roseovarius sp.]MCY4290368.1 septum formation initiator family protein [Roseovarius sp.]MCY4317138.1 septum formation initiator family protein [Roseovarius sp.]